MANDHWSTGAVLVLGGNGKTGRRVAERLANEGRRFRIGSRSGVPAFDWNDRATWAPCLEGMAAAYVSYQPDLAVPGVVETVQAFFELAVGRGVTKLVLLSGRGEPEAEAAEHALQGSGADWTILRCSWFHQNFSENFFLDAILTGEVVLPVGPVAEPFVDVEDIADIAAAALRDPRHSRQLYEITGPKALTFAEAIAEIAQATGRGIAFVPVLPRDYREELVRQQVPNEYIELVLYLFTTVLDGRNTPLADGVQRALGRTPRSFSDYVARTAATGIWGASERLI